MARRAFELQLLHSPMLVRRQVGQLSESVRTPVVDGRARGSQQVTDAPLAKASPRLRRSYEALTDRAARAGVDALRPRVTSPLERLTAAR